MEMGFPFFFSLFTLPFSLAIESRGKGKAENGKEIKKIMRLQDDDNGEKWKTVILIDAILMAKRWGNLKLYDSLCWFNAVAAAKWEIRSVYARFKA